MRIRVLSLLSVLLLVFAVACGDDSDSDGAATDTTAPPSDVTSSTEEAQAVVVIEGAWARTSPSMATNGAAYMDLTSTVDDRLVSAAVSGIEVDSVEVHEVVMDDDTGEMIMREVDGIDLVAGETVHLEPGGYHVMLLGLAEPLEVGASFDVILTFEKAGDVSASVEVRDNTDGAGMGDGHGGGGDMGDGAGDMGDGH